MTTAPPCRGCGKPIISGQLRRGDDWHADCSPLAKFEALPRRHRSRRDDDIKAPDGFLLGGYRKVRRDGTVLFHRRWWKVPDEWVGLSVHVHVLDCYAIDIEVAPPGTRVWDRDEHNQHVNVRPEIVDRPDAKPSYRTAHAKAWHARKS